MLIISWQLWLCTEVMLPRYGDEWHIWESVYSTFKSSSSYGKKYKKLFSLMHLPAPQTALLLFEEYCHDPLCNTTTSIWRRFKLITIILLIDMTLNSILRNKVRDEVCAQEWGEAFCTGSPCSSISLRRLEGTSWGRCLVSSPGITLALHLPFSFSRKGMLFSAKC